jgi:hypothetical protein
MRMTRFFVGINLFAVYLHGKFTHLHCHLGGNSLLDKRSFEPGTCSAKIASEDAATNFNVQFCTPCRMDFNVQRACAAQSAARQYSTFNMHSIGRNFQSQ